MRILNVTPQSIKEASIVIQKGGLVVFPTVDVLISFIYLQLSHRKRESHISSFLLICIFFSFFLMILDVITSYLGLRHSTNHIRLFTGLLFGFSLPLFIVPVLNCQLWRDSINSPLLESTLKRFGLLVIFVLSYLLLQGETSLSFEILSSVMLGQFSLP
ncbi:MAG: DUF2085 domain-containing protein [Actinomycetota bacterium]|nr:DUF2085 domain-containing protein [Actinomycetota bacterium]